MCVCLFVCAQGNSTTRRFHSCLFAFIHDLSKRRSPRSLTSQSQLSDRLREELVWGTYCIWGIETRTRKCIVQCIPRTALEKLWKGVALVPEGGALLGMEVKMNKTHDKLNFYIFPYSHVPKTLEWSQFADQDQIFLVFLVTRHICFVGPIPASSKNTVFRNLLFPFPTRQSNAPCPRLGLQPHAVLCSTPC